MKDDDANNRWHAPKANERIKSRDNDTCVYCGAPGECADYVIPKLMSERASDDNMVMACRECYGKKRIKIDFKSMVAKALRHLESVGEDISWISETTFKNL